MGMFNHILAPLDGSTMAESVLPHLVSMAKVFDARVTVLSVVGPHDTGILSFPVDPVAWEMRKTEAEAYLNEVVCRLEEASTSVDPILMEGNPATCIETYTQNHDVDLVLLSSHGSSGLSRWNVSSVVRKVIQRTHRSFMLIRAYDQPPQPRLQGINYSRLLLTLDGSRRAECLLAPGKFLAQFFKAQLLVAHIIVKPEMPHQMPLTAKDHELITRFIKRNKQVATAYLEELGTRLQHNFEPRLQVGSDAALTLHELVDENAVDLLIMSAHGASGQTKWPHGSITNSFIEYGSVPLLVVQDLKPEEIEPMKVEAVVKERKGH
jgi:nucleotide-binding universal stress UspA family protein